MGGAGAGATGAGATGAGGGGMGGIGGAGFGEYCGDGTSSSAATGIRRKNTAALYSPDARNISLLAVAVSGAAGLAARQARNRSRASA